MKAYMEEFGGKRYIGDIVHDDDYTPRGGIGDIKPEFAYKVVSKTEITLSWKDEPIDSIRTREAEKEQDALKAEIKELETKIEAVNHDTLPTYQEARAKEREWNDTYNEGGYGYVPHYVDKDEYARAVKKLEELKQELRAERPAAGRSRWHRPHGHLEPGEDRPKHKRPPVGIVRGQVGRRCRSMI